MFRKQCCSRAQRHLQHAILNPSMCRFLLEHGLDVDEVATFGSIERTPLQLICSGGLDEVAPIFLEAGADPTYRTRGWIAPLNLAVNRGRLSHYNIVRRIFTESAAFELAEPRSATGKNGFLGVCDAALHAGDVFDAERLKQWIAFLLDRGFSVHDKSDDGSTCLHLILAQFGFSPSFNWTEVLIYLLNRGADVRAVDFCGRTVSDRAYSRVICHYHTHSSYHGDVWDSILDLCGYDILEFRGSCPRIARYNDNYSRRDFELLWKDRESRCPYWDDRAWPHCRKDGDNETMDSSFRRWCLCKWCVLLINKEDESEKDESGAGESGDDDESTGYQCDPSPHLVQRPRDMLGGLRHSCSSLDTFSTMSVTHSTERLCTGYEVDEQGFQNVQAFGHEDTTSFLRRDADPVVEHSKIVAGESHLMHHPTTEANTSEYWELTETPWGS